MTQDAPGGLAFAASRREAAIAERLTGGGYRVIAIEGGQVRTFRDAQVLIAEALRLPASAGRNLDALADSLRDLDLRWPDDPRLVLLWRDADALLVRDLPGWYRLTGVLAEASGRAIQDSDHLPDRSFETVLLVEGFGVGGD